MVTIRKSATINAPAEKIYRNCRRPEFLRRMLPGLTTIRRIEPGLFRCRLTIHGMPTSIDLRVDRSAAPNRIRLHGDQPETHLAVHFGAPETRPAEIEVRAEVDTRSRVQARTLEQVISVAVDNVRVAFGAPSPDRRRDDPLLHTGPRVPPDTPA